MIETPLAIFNVARDRSRGAAMSETRLAGFVMGTNDLAKETRARIAAGPRADAAVACRPASLAARAYGLDVLDGVYNDIGDATALRRMRAGAAIWASTARR